MTTIETNHFVSHAKAVEYHARQNIDAAGVKAKIDGGQIEIGKPRTRGGRLVILDDGCRYGIVEAPSRDISIARKPIVRASVESPNFSFEAYGHNEDEARRALYRGLELHAEREGATGDWLAMAKEDVNISRFAFGKAYRDGTEIKP